MRMLSKPPYSLTDVLHKCTEGMAKDSTKAPFLNALNNLIEKGDEYLLYGQDGQLYRIPYSGKPNNTEIIVRPLSKKTLIGLYENYLRSKKNPARIIWEELIASAKESCPFCGDIGRPTNLDHFLPKAHFPQFSILPINLIPSCSDCNSGEKGNDFTLTAQDQIIHPYLDKSHFFEEQWVTAKYINEDEGAIVYSVNPPADWNIDDKARVEEHFKSLNLAKRYSIEAASHLSEIISLRNASYSSTRKLIPNIEESSLITHFLDTTITPISTGPLFANHWKKTMYATLANTEEFLKPR